jgi:hypothetical protein
MGIVEVQCSIVNRARNVGKWISFIGKYSVYKHV